MNKKIILISTALLLSNLGFAYDVQTIRDLEVPISQNIVYDINNDVIASLVNKGLDSSVAKERIASVWTSNVLHTNIMVHNIQEGCSALNVADITEFIASAALFEKSVDLASYDTLVRIAQMHNDLHVNETVLDELHEVAAKNKKILQLA